MLSLFQSRSHILVATFILLLSQQALAKKIAYFWGGGGEPQARSTTIFDVDLETLGPVLLGAGYEINLAFAVGHKDSEKLADKIVGFGKNKPFTVKTVTEELKKLSEKITQGEISEGDQILFIIATHGDDPDDHPGVETHMVRVTNFKKNEGIGLDRLFAIRDLAEKNNIKFAVMDFSCYAGATLALASAKACVVASSTAQELSYTNTYANMAPELARDLRAGVDLESAFLKTRKRVNDYSSPEISTFANSIAKIQTIRYSTASSPLKPAKSGAAFNRHLSYLKEVHQKSFQDLAPILLQIPESQEILNMKGVRETYHNFLSKSKDVKVSFDELNNAKSMTLIKYYFNERVFYRRVYEQFENSPGPNPCRDFKF